MGDVIEIDFSPTGEPKTGIPEWERQIFLTVLRDAWSGRKPQKIKLKVPREPGASACRDIGCLVAHAFGVVEYQLWS